MAQLYVVTSEIHLHDNIISNIEVFTTESRAKEYMSANYKVTLKKMNIKVPQNGVRESRGNRYIHLFDDNSKSQIIYTTFEKEVQ